MHGIGWLWKAGLTGQGDHVRADALRWSCIAGAEGAILPRLHDLRYQHGI